MSKLMALNLALTVSLLCSLAQLSTSADDNCLTCLEQQCGSKCKPSEKPKVNEAPKAPAPSASIHPQQPHPPNGQQQPQQPQHPPNGQKPQNPSQQQPPQQQQPQPGPGPQSAKGGMNHAQKRAAAASKMVEKTAAELQCDECIKTSCMQC